MSQVFLVDGSSVFFRAYHAIRDLSRSDGMATNAIYGYVSTMRSLLRDYQPKEMVVAHDSKEVTFRNELDENYKANREAPPEDLLAQIPYIKRITEMMGIRQIEQVGYEADDLIGTLASWLAKKGREVLVVSLDKDLLQLVDTQITMLRLAPMNKSKIYGSDEVKERYGVTPNQFIDILALMGDAVDNVPGVPGIGEKTAISLIQEYGDLDTLYKNLDNIKGKKRQENLRNFKEQAYLSKRLVTVKTDIEIELDNDYFTIQPPDKNALLGLYQELEFRTFANELDSDSSQHTVSTEVNYQTLDTIEALEEVASIIKKKGRCAIDTETTSLVNWKARIVGVSLSVEPHQGWYIPIAHNIGTNIDGKKGQPLLREIVESEEIKKTGHNLKFDFHSFANEGLTLAGIEDDTLIASYLLQPEQNSHKLDDLVFTELGMRLTPISELIGSGKKQISMADVEIEKASYYACEDSDASWRLWDTLIPRFQGGLRDLYRDVEMPLLSVLANMERRGITVDPDVLEEQSNALGEELHGLEETIYEAVGKKFNLNSPLQLAEILYDDLKLLTGRKRSTRADILEKLAEEGIEIARQILDYRHRQKIKSTYLDALRKLINPSTGRVHTTFNQAVATTGRISSSDPNLQNIPIRTELGRRVRRAFVASEGTQLLSLDYSQIELRVLAHISKDPGLIEAFSNKEDIHSRTAAEVFDVDIADVTPDMRRKAKEINFGLNYGMSPYGLARRLGIQDAEASKYIETYFHRYPRVQQYMDETVVSALENRWVETILHRRIPTRGIDDSNRMRQENAKRAAINAPIQGSAADMLKVAMVRIDNELNLDHASILLTVHDELVLEVKDDYVDTTRDLCRDIMENAVPLEVPTPVEVSTGSSWADLK